MATVPTDEQFLAYNETVVREFRTHGGVVTEPNFPVLVLTTTGARTGRRTSVPLAYGTDAGRVFVVGSKAGAPRHPAWFHNLQAYPEVTVELGTGVYESRAVVTEGAERQRLYDLIAGDGASDHASGSTRVFPVIVLEGVPAPDLQR
jgi:deazaflavin-dependent oxidoreductase (nitroreductase family)